MIYKTVIIGAGASGLMVASQIKNGSVAIIDGNSKIGAKIEVAGGGKCNVTNQNISSKNYDGNSQFFDSVYKKFNNIKLLDFLKNRGVETTKQNRVVKNQYFCKSSKEVINLFKKSIKATKLFLNEKVISVSKENTFIIKTDKQTIEAENLVVASGGVSFPQLGATNIGYKIAETFGHKIIKDTPALVGFTVLPEQKWFKELSGLSAEVRIRVGEREILGNLLFAHKGVTGPAMMVSSLYWKKGKMSIDFLPHTSIKKLLDKNSNKNISSALPFPKRLTKSLLLEISLLDKQISKLTKNDIIKLEILKNYEFSPAGNFGYSRAEVTRGGVSTNEINPFTLESNLVKGLYFTGEVMDITGELGGYNLQWAFSSGVVCGDNIV